MRLAWAWEGRTLPWELVAGGEPSERWRHSMRMHLRAVTGGAY